MSNVDPTKPTSPIALTRDVRKNFEIIKAELEVIQEWIANGGAAVNPAFTGLASFADIAASGTANIAVIQPGSEIPIASQEITLVAAGEITSIVPLGGGPPLILVKDALGTVHLTGFNEFTTNVMAAEQTIAPVGTVQLQFRPSQNTSLLVCSGADNTAWRVTFLVDGSIKLMKMIGALPDTATHPIYWNGSYLL